MEKIKLVKATEEEMDFVEDRLEEYNNESKPFEQEVPFVPFRYVVKSADNDIIGGICAYAVMWKILYIDTLWVAPEYRGFGHGTDLLRKVEQDAIDFGCQIAHLDSFDFQGPEFYMKNGYEVFGVLNDSPRGHREYFLTKKLD